MRLLRLPSPSPLKELSCGGDGTFVRFVHRSVDEGLDRGTGRRSADSCRRSRSERRSSRETFACFVVAAAADRGGAMAAAAAVVVFIVAATCGHRRRPRP
jgi:hypothetical protein